MFKITLSAVAALLALSFIPDYALAQSRVFVAAQGSDSNPCTFAAPCRTFQRAHDVVAIRGEIDVLDPAGYGAINITKSISIQGHGFSGVTVTGGNAITINAPETAVVKLNGLLLEGSGTGTNGVGVTTVGHLFVGNTTIRNFSIGLDVGSRNTSNPSLVYVSNTDASHNLQNGVLIQPASSQFVYTTLSHVEVVGNGKDGIFINADFTSNLLQTSIVECVVSGNGVQGNANTPGIHTRGTPIGGNSDNHTDVIRTYLFANVQGDFFVEVGSSVTIGESNFKFVFSNGGVFSTYGDNHSPPLPSFASSVSTH